MSTERLRGDYESQQVAMRELRYELSRGKEHLSHLDAQQLALAAEVEQLQQERVVLAGQRRATLEENSELRGQRGATLEENSELRETCRLREEQLAAIREQVERYVLNCIIM